MVVKDQTQCLVQSTLRLGSCRLCSFDFGRWQHGISGRPSHKVELLLHRLNRPRRNMCFHNSCVDACLIPIGMYLEGGTKHPEDGS